jgi:hypothetical protein
VLQLYLICIHASRQWCSNVSGPLAALDPAYVFHLLFSFSDTTWETLTLLTGLGTSAYEALFFNLSVSMCN